MKHFYYTFVLLTVLLASCSDKYVIKGTSSQDVLDGKVAYIKHANGDEFELIDSCKIVHGKFEMTGLVDSIMCASLFMGEHNCVPLVLEYGDITVSIVNSSVKIGGTPLNDKLFDFLSSRDSLMLNLAELPSMRNMMILEGYDLMDIERELARNEQETMRNMHKLVKEFVVNNFDNVLGMTWFMQLCEEATAINGYPSTSPLIEEIYICAPDEFKQHPTISSFMKSVDEAMFSGMPKEQQKHNPTPPMTKRPDPNVHTTNY